MMQRLFSMLMVSKLENLFFNEYFLVPLNTILNSGNLFEITKMKGLKKI
jgi:hypothetical protein